VRLGRIAYSLLAASVLLSACGGGEGGAEGGEAERSVKTDSGGSSVTSDIYVQMTGLALLVPPDTVGGALDVYLPKARGGGHRALLGFAVPTGYNVPPGLCHPMGPGTDTTKFCYVNLAQWTLEPFGGGGSPRTQPRDSFPPVGISGLLNVTELSGGEYRVFPGVATGRSERKVTFVSGQLVDSLACKLAEWTVRHMNAGGTQQSVGRDSLSNVAVWAMTGLDSASARLVFTRGGGQPVTVPLPAGQTWLLLAHIHQSELAHLPPNTATSVTKRDTADFEPFYDLLSRSNQLADTMHHKIAHRSRPDSASGVSTPCRVRLLTGEDKRIDPSTTGTNSMATYACIPAWGGGS
jgi:hypothetical protein